MLHVYIHQPNEQKPGLNAWFGTEFNRHNTWFGKSKSWIDYLRRCSVMLQTGQSVADFAVFITEDTPKMTGPKGGGIPVGHDFDFINSDAILHRLTVRDGHLVLPDGIRYAALILPDSATMRPAVARKLQELAKAGAKIIGPKPTRSPSLQNHPACDAETRQLATWKDLPNAAALGLQPDVIAPADILWKHRQTADLDIYFLSNQSAKERTETLSFRTAGRPASLWNAVNSEIRPIAHAEANGRSSISLRLPPQGSIFVVFGAAVPGSAVAETPSTREIPVSGPWTVEFPSRKITLRNWSAGPAARRTTSATIRARRSIRPKWKSPNLEPGSYSTSAGSSPWPRSRSTASPSRRFGLIPTKSMSPAPSNLARTPSRSKL